MTSSALLTRGVCAVGFAAALGLTTSHADARRTVFLFFPDGTTPVPEGRSCKGHKVPPAYRCSFGGVGSTRACQNEIQGFLDRMYAEFDVEFTTTLPTSGPFYTIVANSNWPECAASEKENGVADLSCNDYNGNVGYVFNCGTSAHACAVTIAHEHGHLVGLEHTDTDQDVMWPRQCKSCNGFADRSMGISGKSECARSSQNSYQMMLTRLGVAPSSGKGGIHCEDEAVPALLILSPESNVPQVGRSVHLSAVATDECGVHFVEFSVGREAIRIYSPPFETDLAMPNEEHLTLTVTAEDNIGKRETTVVMFTQDLAQRPPDPPTGNGCLCSLKPGRSPVGAFCAGLGLVLAALRKLRSGACR